MLKMFFLGILSAASLMGFFTFYTWCVRNWDDRDSFIIVPTILFFVFCITMCHVWFNLGYDSGIADAVNAVIVKAPVVK